MLAMMPVIAMLAMMVMMAMLAMLPMMAMLALMAMLAVVVASGNMLTLQSAGPDFYLTHTLLF